MNDRDNGPRRAQRGWMVAGAAAIVVAAVTTILALTSPGTDSPARPSASPTEPARATVSITSADGSDLLRELAVDIRPSADGEPVDVLVDAGVSAQRIHGFGAAMTHASADLLSRMPDDQRAALLEELFAPDGPVRLSVLRLPIGASDFVDTEAFTFDDLPQGETDWELDRFSIEPDRQSMIPMLEEALAINPDLRLIASPWSPPAWLKTSGSLEGGRLLDEDRAYETYAAYLVRFLEEYRAAGIDIHHLTVQNEPQLRHPDGYPGTDMPFWQEAKLIATLGPALDAAGIATGILGFDHNWELAPGDAATTPEGEDPAYLYPSDLLHTSAAEWIDGIAFHCYFGNAQAQSRLLDEFPDIEIFVTECSGSSAPGEAREKVFADTLAWQSRNLLIDSLQNHASAVLTWNLVLDENGGPHRGGCETCSGVVTVASDGTVTRNAEYFLLAQAARFIPPGSMSVDSSSASGDLHQSAFVTPQGATVLLLWNSSDEARSVDIGDDGRSLTVEIPGTSLSTISWGASASS